MRRIALLTSGGDAPGMNVAIWAVVRAALAEGVEVLGVQHGYRGLVEGDMAPLGWAEVGDVMAYGGTVLGTSRYPEFRTALARAQALWQLEQAGVEGLIVVGGDGSVAGASALAAESAVLGQPLGVVAIPGTIDNDMAGSAHAIGAASALAATVDALRQMTAPAQALHRIFCVEVMGRYCGYLAAAAALSSGADAVILPEQVLAVAPGEKPWTERVLPVATEANLARRLEEVAAVLLASFRAGQRHGFVVVGEGAGSLAAELAAAAGMPSPCLGSGFIQQELEQTTATWPAHLRPDVRSQALGYPVRGCAPAPFDTWLGSFLGASAVQALLLGRINVMVGCTAQGTLCTTPLHDVVRQSGCTPQERWGQHYPAWNDLLALHDLLSRPPHSAS